MILTTQDLADAFGVGIRRAEQWCKAGRVPGAQKAHREWVIDVERADGLRVDGIEARPQAGKDGGLSKGRKGQQSG